MSVFVSRWREGVLVAFERDRGVVAVDVFVARFDLGERERVVVSVVDIGVGFGSAFAVEYGL